MKNFEICEICECTRKLVIELTAKNMEIKKKLKEILGHLENLTKFEEIFYILRF